MRKIVKTAFIFILISQIISLISCILTFVGLFDPSLQWISYLELISFASYPFDILAYVYLMKLNKRFKTNLCLEIIEMTLNIGVSIFSAFAFGVLKNYDLTIQLSVYIVRLILILFMIYQIALGTIEIFGTNKESSFYKIITLLGGSLTVVCLLTIFINVLYVVNTFSETTQEKLVILRNLLVIFNTLNPLIEIIFSSIVIKATNLLDDKPINKKNKLDNAKSLN